MFNFNRRHIETNFFAQKVVFMGRSDKYSNTNTRISFDIHGDAIVKTRYTPSVSFPEGLSFYYVALLDNIK
jgi:hypothetical protein